MSIPKQTYYVSSDELINISSDKPLTYIEWLQYETAFSKTDAFEEYSVYLNKWYTNKGINSQQAQSTYIRNIYINLLKQVTLDYTSTEEKRFLTNIDYNNDKDLDVALPFFAKKLKQIAIYYADKRDEIKFVPTKVNLKGSNYGISQLVVSEIINILKNDSVAIDMLTTTGLTVQDVLANIDVNIVELIDTEQNYYNIPETSLASDYSDTNTKRFEYFNMSILPDSTQLFITETFNQAIIETIKQVPVNLNTNNAEELRDTENSSLAITDIVTGTELDRLDVSNFVDYTYSGDLNKLYEKMAFEKYIGTDYYYLSTGDSLSDAQSGQLFKAKAPHRNILNKYNPTILTVPGENLYKSEYLGGFFSTETIGLLNYTTLDFQYDLSSSPNTIVYFPDPTTGARGFYGSYELNTQNISYYENVNWQKHKVTEHFAFGRQKQYTNITRFSPYQSANDTLKQPHVGVSRYNDEFSFWKPTKSGKWSQDDIFKKSSTQIQPIQERQENLLTGNKNIYTWKTDIYGNNYIMTKTNVDPEKRAYMNTNNTIYDTEYVGTSPGSQSSNKNRVTNEYHLSKNLTEQASLSGELYVRCNTSTGTKQLTSDTLSGIYSKYKVPGTIEYEGTTIPLTAISSEIEKNLTNFDILYDTIIFETSNYIIFEKIIYDYETSIITSGQSNFTFIKKQTDQPMYEKASNWWFDEANNRVLVGKTTIYPVASATTDRMIYPEVYVYTLNSNTLTKAYPDQDYTESQLLYETSQYSLSSIIQDTSNKHDIINIHSPRITYNKDSQRFQVIYTATDPAENIYLFKNDFRMYDETVEYLKTNLYCNKYLNYTMNAADGTPVTDYFNETNTNITTDTWFHSNELNTVFMSSTELAGEPVPVVNSSSVWTYGNNYFNFTGDRDVVITFDFAMSGTTANPALSSNGLSVLFYKARKVENIKNYKGGIPNENYELLDDGGLGPAFSYFPDLSGTSTNPSLSGLDSAHAAVIFDNIGNLAGDTTSPGNSITTVGPYLSRNTYKNTISLTDKNLSLWQDITGKTYADLEYTRCKVVLTNIGREVRVYFKDIYDKYELISTTDISAYFPADYTAPRRLKVSLASNTSSTPGIAAIKNITITGAANVDDSLVIIT